MLRWSEPYNAALDYSGYVKPEQEFLGERNEISPDSESVTRLNFMRAVFQVCGRFPN
jgi:hypothetical protein